MYPGTRPSSTQVMFNGAAKDHICDDKLMHDPQRLIFMTISYARPSRLEKLCRLASFLQVDGVFASWRALEGSPSPTATTTRVRPS